MGYYDHVPDKPKPKTNTPTVNAPTGGSPPPATSTAGPTSPASSDWVQRVRDFSDRLSNNFLLNMGDPIVSGVGRAASSIESGLGFTPSEAATAAANLPALRLQRAKMNQQMPATDKAAADFVGQFNPSMFLRGIPAVGPIVQGGVQEGVKGYAQGESWPQIQKDALVGAGGGALSGATSTPEAMGATLGRAVTSGGPAALGWLYGGKADDVLGGMGGPGGAVGGALGGGYLLDPWNEAIKKAVSSGVPPVGAEVGSYAPLAAASYWNQQQRDQRTLSGQGQ
jgi:hypothetical protein